MEELKTIKIFLVDDDMFCLHMYEEYLRKTGYADISTFYSGYDILANIEEKPDVVFIDYDMGGMNGIETLKKIKLHNPLTYVIMVSGQESKQVMTEAYEFGAFEYIRKGEAEPQKMVTALLQISNIQKIMNQHIVVTENKTTNS